MLEGVAPVTRLRIADDALGCAMLTAEPCPIEKPCQLTTALWLDWVMFICLAEGCAIATLPAATLPPVGSVCACANPGTASAQRSAVEASKVRIEVRIILLAERSAIDTNIIEPAPTKK